MSIVQPEHRAKRRKVDANGAKGLAFGRVGCPADVAALQWKPAEIRVNHFKCVNMEPCAVQ